VALLEGSSSTPIACVLAGGRSRRLGRPKASVVLAGRPLISYPLAALGAAGLEAVVIAKPDSDVPSLEVPVLHEAAAVFHPAAGIAAALRHARGRPVLVVACDMPFLEPGLLRHLAEAPGRVVVPRAGGRLHPLCARYAPALEGELEDAVAAGRALHETIAALDPVVVDEDGLRRFGDPERLLFNVNSPEDLALAEELLG